jgi:hypothetical protein
MWKPFPDWLVLPDKAKQIIFVGLALVGAGLMMWWASEYDQSKSADAQPIPTVTRSR